MQVVQSGDVIPISGAARHRRGQGVSVQPATSLFFTTD